jgi:predicted phage-related endonuclease
MSKAAAYPPTEIPTPDDDAWFEARRPRVTSTDSAALLGVHPQKTALEVYLEITGQKDPEAVDSERAFWGQQLESAVAYGIANRYGLTIRPYKTMLARPDHDDRVAANFDFEVTAADPNAAHDPELRQTTRQIADLLDRLGPGLLEVKTVDDLVYRNSWIEDDGGIEAAHHIEVQCQHQMAVSGHGWLAIGALIGGNAGKLTLRERHGALISRLESEWGVFLARVDNGHPLQPDYNSDYRNIDFLNGEGDPKAELSDEAREEIARQREVVRKAAAEKKAAEEREREADGRIKELMGDAQKAVFDDFTVSYKPQPAQYYTQADVEAVREKAAAGAVKRKASRTLRITARKSKQQNDQGDDGQQAAA